MGVPSAPFAFAPVAGHHILTWIIIGLIAGLLAAKLVHGSGLGVVRDTLTGLVGAVIGGFILHAAGGRAHHSARLIVEIFVSFVGAVVFLLIQKATTRHGAR